MLRAVVLLLAEFTALYVFGIAVHGGLFWALGGKSSPLAFNISGLAVTVVWFGYVYWRDHGMVWTWGKPSPWALLLLAGFLGGWAAGRGSLSLTQAASRVPLILRPSESAALELCLLAPFREEILWRGFLLRRLSALTGLWPALVISALLFAPGHPSLIRAAVVGLVLGLFYSPLGTGSLLAAMVIHVLFNLTSIPPSWIPIGR